MYSAYNGLDSALMYGRAAGLQRARTRGATALGDKIGIAVYDRNPVDGNAQLICRDHRE